MTDARAAALRVLTACRRSGAWADAALAATLSSAQLSPADAALCSRIVYGVMQNRLLLDYRLSAFCTQKPERLQPPLADILRIGAYQILFMDRIPVSAAVNESVRLAKENGRTAASGLVNAVLRRLDREKNSLPPLPEDETERLSVAYSHPRWLVERFIDLLGREEAEKLLRADNEIAPLTVQVNPLKTTPRALREELRSCGIEAEEDGTVEGALILRGTGELTRLKAFAEGRFTVQDTAAHMVALAAAYRGNTRVLDVCAAPGGKTFDAAFAMENTGEIVACDLHENKLKRIRDGAKRLGLTSIKTLAADGRVFIPEWEESFDTVLCDVPCSGLGVIRKKPDIRYKDKESLSALPAIQSEILDNSCRYVRPGGVLLYSTCTLLPEENERQIEDFLVRHKDFTAEEFTLPSGEKGAAVTLWQHRGTHDGFFISKLRKQNG